VPKLLKLQLFLNMQYRLGGLFMKVGCTCDVAKSICDRRTCDSRLQPFVNRAANQAALHVLTTRLCVCLFVGSIPC